MHGKGEGVITGGCHSHLILVQHYSSSRNKIFVQYLAENEVSQINLNLQFSHCRCYTVANMQSYSKK